MNKILKNQFEQIIDKPEEKLENITNNNHPFTENTPKENILINLTFNFWQTQLEYYSDNDGNNSYSYFIINKIFFNLKSGNCIFQSNIDKKDTIKLLSKIYDKDLVYRKPLTFIFFSKKEGQILLKLFNINIF